MMDMAIEYIHTAKTIYNICCGGVANCLHIWEFSLPKSGALNYSSFIESRSSKSFFFILKKSTQLSQAKIWDKLQWLIINSWLILVEFFNLYLFNNFGDEKIETDKKP